MSLVKPQYYFLAFGAAMTLETYFGMAYRAMSLQILELRLGGVEFGYILGAMGLVSGAGLILNSRIRGRSRPSGTP